MGIEVILPVRPSTAQRITLARRGPVPADAVLGLVDNGKPHADELLVAIAEDLERRGVVRGHFLWRKPTASRPMTPEECDRMLARAHLVITGVGD